MKKELVICSFGLKPAHVTAETLSEIQKCSAVFTHCLDERTASFLRPFCRELHFLRDLPPEKIGARLLSCLAEGGRAAFITYGNPLFLNAATRQIAEQAAAGGVKVRILDAVSSLDSLVNTLGLNRFSVSGLRLVDLSACDCLPESTPGMDTLFFAASDLNLPRFRKAKVRFFASLLAAYAPGHRVVLADCEGFKKERLLKSSVQRLDKDIVSAGAATTLFIPAMRAAEKKSRRA